MRASESLDHGGSCSSTDPLREIRIGAQGIKATKRVAVSVEEKSIGAIVDQLAISATAAQDDWEPAGHRLDDDSSGCLTPGGIGSINESVERMWKVVSGNRTHG